MLAALMMGVDAVSSTCTADAGTGTEAGTTTEAVADSSFVPEGTTPAAVPGPKAGIETCAALTVAGRAADMEADGASKWSHGFVDALETGESSGGGARLTDSGGGGGDGTDGGLSVVPGGPGGGGGGGGGLRILL